MANDPKPAYEKADLYKVRARARAAGRENLGLRERHKIDKLERICDAAHLLFGREGYERTTLREIANEAGVALGTLSLYARDKRDLVFLIFNKLIPPILEQGRRNTTDGASLADNMAAFFEPFYRTFAANVLLFRIILGQIYNGPPSVHVEENNAIRQRLHEHLADLVLRAMTSGECSPDVDVSMQSRSFYYLYFAAVRVWLSRDNPTPKEGIAELRSIFRQHVQGLLKRGAVKKKA